MSAERIRQIQGAWNLLGSGSLAVVDEIYARDVQFEDPISKGRGSENLKRHFGRLFRSFSRISYSYGRTTWTAETLVIEWTLKAERGATAKVFELPGISWLQLDPETGKIVRSREYFDLGKGLYERIPVLGYFLRRVRKSLQRGREVPR